MRQEQDERERERERKRTTRTMKMLFSLISVVKKYHVEAVVVVVGPKKAILRRKNKINFQVDF